MIPEAEVYRQLGLAVFLGMAWVGGTLLFLGVWWLGRRILGTWRRDREQPLWEWGR